MNREREESRWHLAGLATSMSGSVNFWAGVMDGLPAGVGLYAIGCQPGRKGRGYHPGTAQNQQVTGLLSNPSESLNANTPHDQPFRLQDAAEQPTGQSTKTPTWA